jgi:hypothetical protein
MEPPAGIERRPADYEIGRRGRTRTCDPRLRRPVLYPAELRAREPHYRPSGALPAMAFCWLSRAFALRPQSSVESNIYCYSVAVQQLEALA